MTQFFDDQIRQEITVLTPEMFHEITDYVRLHALETVSEILDNLPDSPACDRLKKYFGVFSGSYHLLTSGLMHENGTISEQELKKLIAPYIRPLIQFLQEAKTNGEMEKFFSK